MRGISVNKTWRTGRRGYSAFSLAELLVVCGVIAILIALLVPPLSAAQLQAKRVQCAAHLQQLGIGLQASHTEFQFYPYWDDESRPIRFSWIDVLVQRRFVGDHRVGYCPVDTRPDSLNQARARASGVYYPNTSSPGVDYSFGMGAPLSAGAWRVASGHRRTGDDLPRRFDDSDRYMQNRILAADANWTFVYNLSGDALESGVWNSPAWYDNLVAWRHGSFGANVLMQDGHAQQLLYRIRSATPVDTNRAFVWHPNESLHVGPDSRHNGNLYPDLLAPNFNSTPPGEVFPKELIPYYYTLRGAWTRILHKRPN